MPNRRILHPPAGFVEWNHPAARLDRQRRAFFPQSKALGLDVGWTLSPELSQQVAYLGTVLPSFYQAENAVAALLHIPHGRKLIERHTERIGAERVTLRESELDKHEQRTLMAIAAGASRTQILDEPLFPLLRSGSLPTINPDGPIQCWATTSRRRKLFR
jgi:hypothetical protein